MKARATAVAALLVTFSVSACSTDRLAAPLENTPPAALAVAPSAALPSLQIAADLTRSVVTAPGKYFRLVSLNSTIPAGYSVVLVDGVYYGVAPNISIGSYKGQYFLLPTDASFGRDLLKTQYGYFCGAGWGWNSDLSGNSRKLPVPDGGTDQACLQHDKAWSAASMLPTTTQRYDAVRAADRVFLSALNSVRSRWAYEADYLAAARTWMNCRVIRQVAVTGIEACQLQWRLVGTVIMAKRVR